MNVKKIESYEELVQVQLDVQRFFLLKNSITCPVSSEALKEMDNYANLDGSISVYYLNVQELREVSNEVARQYEVKHESPQVLLFQKNEIVWHTSHWEITKKNLQQAVADELK